MSEETENAQEQENVYEIFNPSDAYTIKGRFMDCAVAVAILGGGAYGIEGTPVLIGWAKWIKEKGLDLTEYVKTNKSQLVKALESVLIGDKNERVLVEVTLKTMPEDKHEEWLAYRHNLKRSSMNDIGARAKAFAQHLKEKV
jgi:hypothetical protein